MRVLWRGVEAVHDVVYFAPEAATTYAEVGCRGWWMGYFASRAAAVGPVGPDVVTALFFGFAPVLVERAIPDAWRLADREAVLAARRRLGAFALARALAGGSGPGNPSPGRVQEPEPFPIVDDELARAVAVAGETTRRMLEAAPRAGRPLFAAHAALMRPEDPVGALWHDATALREFRGDGHISALLQFGLDGCSANRLMAALGLVPAAQRERRGWTEQEWASAGAELTARGWLDEDGTATEAGRVARRRIETATDVACEPALTGLDGASRQSLAAALGEIAGHISRTGAVPYPNPTGVPAV